MSNYSFNGVTALSILDNTTDLKIVDEIKNFFFKFLVIRYMLFCLKEVCQALIYFHRIHPEAQRILGNSCIPVVSLERLNFQSVSLLSLQPVVSLVRLPCQKQDELHGEVLTSDCRRQVKVKIWTL